VIASGRFINGPEVGELEEALGERCSVEYVVGCSSGTDALLLALLALDIGPGDAVVVPSFTFTATAEVVALRGGTPVFADVLPDTYNIDPDSALACLEAAQRHGLRPRAILPVDLFGQPADYDRLIPLAAEHDVAIVVDAAQSFGATWRDQSALSTGVIAATSFFPTKPLGCYGDGGAAFTQDARLDGVMRSAREHGQGDDKYDTVRVGMNARLDTLQAAVLLAKLAIFDEELAARRRVAARYTEELTGAVGVPIEHPHADSAWAQYTIQVDRRDDVVQHLSTAGISPAVYYPRPLHLQAPYRDCPADPNGCPVAEDLAGRVLSIPLHPYLSDVDQDHVVRAVREAVGTASVAPQGAGAR
jgi:dTDP-4-amino-4,6-dideoxygalactose transaminase